MASDGASVVKFTINTATMPQFHHHIQAPERKVKWVPDTPSFSHTYSYVRYTVNDLDEQFIEWLESKKLGPRIWSNIILFYAHPGTSIAVHTDAGPQTIWAINCLLTPGDLEMKWCESSEGELNDNGLKYIKHSPDSRVLESTRLRDTICRIGVPHTSTNHGQGCWLMSMRVYPQAVPWASICARFGV